MKGAFTMSRLGEKIHQERTKKGLSIKDVAKKSGVADSFLLEIESGKRIINDTVASRILKNIGIATDLADEFEDVKEPAKIEVKALEEKKQPKQPTLAVNDQWQDALTGIVKRVPIYDMSMKIIDHRLTPIQGEKIDGFHPEKVFYVECRDNAMSGFRILKGDRLLITPVHGPVNDGIMLVEYNGKRVLRKVKKMEGNKVLLISQDRELASDTQDMRNVIFAGQAVRVEFSVL